MTISPVVSGEGLVAAQSSNALAMGLCEAFSVSGLAGEADKGGWWWGLPHIYIPTKKLWLRGREYC